jgi:hypothetical protein
LCGECLLLSIETIAFPQGFIYEEEKLLPQKANSS